MPKVIGQAIKGHIGANSLCDAAVQKLNFFSGHHEFRYVLQCASGDNS